LSPFAHAFERNVEPFLRTLRKTEKIRTLAGNTLTFHVEGCGEGKEIKLERLFQKFTGGNLNRRGGGSAAARRQAATHDVLLVAALVPVSMPVSNAQLTRKSRRKILPAPGNK
jgi:hypothetical protein